MNVKARWMDYLSGRFFWTEVVEAMTPDGKMWIVRGRKEQQWTDSMLFEEQQRAEQRVSTVRAEQAIAEWTTAKKAILESEIRLYRLDAYHRYGVIKN